MPAPTRATLAAACTLALWACKGPAKTDAAPSATAQAQRGTAESPWLVGMSQCNLGEPWRVQMNADVKKAAEKHPNLKLVFKDAQNDSLRQRAQVEELVAQKIDLLIISPKEAAPLTQPVAEAYKKKIPVIVLDRAVQGDDYTTFIGADNVKIGREAGKWAVKALGGKGLIVELKGLMTSTPGQDRNRGFREGLELDKHPGLEVVFEADMQWLEPNARKEMESALTTRKKIDLVYAHNDPGAHGAYLAAKAAGREKELKLVGIDALPHEGVEYVKQGILDATFLYPTGGAEAIDSALDLLAGKSVPKKIVLGTRAFTKENVSQGGEAIP
ncbi:MAG: substrate-binding domain-containing protein [Myxococcales bacterium]|nr:substrate-binding domain-containing protein [Myxococcales bacterium]